MHEEPPGVFPHTTKGPLGLLAKQDIKGARVSIHLQLIKESTSLTPSATGIPSQKCEMDERRQSQAGYLRQLQAHQIAAPSASDPCSTPHLCERHAQLHV